MAWQTDETSSAGEADVDVPAPPSRDAAGDLAGGVGAGVLDPVCGRRRPGPEDPPGAGERVAAGDLGRDHPRRQDRPRGYLRLAELGVGPGVLGGPGAGAGTRPVP